MADVARMQGLTYRGVDLDGGSLIPQEVAETMVESISTWVPMPWHAMDDAGYMGRLWDRMATLQQGLPRPSLGERIRGRQTVQGPKWEHDFNIGWRFWLAGEVAVWRARLDVKRHARQWLHDRYFGDLCSEREDYD